MNEAQFWSLIEQAWKEAGDSLQEREKLARGKLSEADIDDLMDSMMNMVEILREKLFELEKADLLEFDRILERKLFEIDRAEVQERTDGSDDGFLYARGFIVAAGQAYYDAVNATPKIAVLDAECEEMCYLSFHVYEERFGDMPDSKISRESGSNKKGWPELADD
jgi:hypothetical protein